MSLEKCMETAGRLLLATRGVIRDPDPDAALKLLSGAMQDGALAVAPLAIGLMVIGIAAAAAQGGIKPASKLFLPKFSRLNPMKGFKQKMGPQAWWEGAKALIKTVVLGGVLYWSVQDLMPQLMAAGSLPLASLLETASSAAVTLIQWSSGAGLVMAAADYAMVKRRTNKQLRMTKQEVKEEYKSTEGDPHVKGHIRQRQMAMSRNRMMAELPKADVVIVNPTHVAVALRYDPAKGAPRVVAKGAGAIAAKIREAASEHRIPMVQDVPLARTLYKNCELNQEVPAEMYGAVAKVLAFVMTLKARGSAAGLHRRVA
jgi:flagellar biosynthetic protein FlhB